MKALMHWVTENEAVLTMMTALLTFFLGRYTSYREDYREGRKEINDTFYKPFLELYDNEHHSMAWYYTDLSLEMQNSIMEICSQTGTRFIPESKIKYMSWICIFQAGSARCLEIRSWWMRRKNM